MHFRASTQLPNPADTKVTRRGVDVCRNRDKIDPIENLYPRKRVSQIFSGGWNSAKTEHADIDLRVYLCRCRIGLCWRLFAACG